MSGHKGPGARTKGDLRGVPECDSLPGFASDALGLLTVATAFPDSGLLSAGPVAQAAWWCGRLWGNSCGRAVVAFGKGGHYKTPGAAYTFDRFVQREYSWPAQSAQLLADALEAAPEVDVYVSVLLHETDTRGRGSATAAAGRIAWADVDGAWTQSREDALVSRGLTAWHVSSGSGGGRHVYVPLDEAMEPDRLEHINRRLGVLLSADSGWSRTKVLRLPGTYNHKRRPLGGRATPVAWLS